MSVQTMGIRTGLVVTRATYISIDKMFIFFEKNVIQTTEAFYIVKTFIKHKKLLFQNVVA